MATENLSTMNKVECSHLKDCCDMGKEKCTWCKNNKKRSYFEPADETYRYYWPYYPQPYYPYWVYPCTTTTWTLSGDGLTMPNTSYFTEA